MAVPQVGMRRELGAAQSTSRQLEDALREAEILRAKLDEADLKVGGQVSLLAQSQAELQDVQSQLAEAHMKAALVRICLKHCCTMELNETCKGGCQRSGLGMFPGFISYFDSFCRTSSWPEGRNQPGISFWQGATNLWVHEMRV